MNSNLIELKNQKSRLIIQYLLALTPLIMFGIYKNAINLYLNGVSITTILSLLLFPILGSSLGMVIDIINNKKLKIDFNFLIGLIIGLITPYSCNIIVFLIAFLFLFIINKIDLFNNLNYICIISIIIILGLCFLAKFDYRNILEINNKYSYSLFDKFIGFNIGGLFTTSILASIIGYIILSFNKLYKKEIAIISLITYMIILTTNILVHNLHQTINLMLNSNNIFGIIFIAPLCIFTPIGKKQTMIFSIIIGIIGGIISIIGLPDIAIMISILVANIINSIILVFKNIKNI